MTVKQKKRGRPSQGKNRLSRESIVLDAKEWLLRENRKISIRALANHLEVDAMAIYHYFPNKAALLKAITVSIMQDIYMPDSGGNWQEELTALCSSYLALLRDHPGLLETLLSIDGVHAPAAVFTERFNIAITPLNLAEDQREVALDLLADYLHGFALAMQCSAKDLSPEVSDIEGPLALYLRALEVSVRPHSSNG